ncbi:hypothetical protein DL770_009112 [Monosporascus sp. CRB-9-2]|nr:hypothetical protein DL770_009112 [Monosporascus sp. CRB-9-2]
MEPPTKRLKIGQAPYEDDREENEDELAMTPFQFDTQQDPMYQLDKGRAKAATRLKSTFEHIFEKYEKDFTGVGDEIDLETGEIVVNNGHLESLREPNEDGSASSDEEERMLRGKSSRNGSQSKSVMKAPSSSSDSPGQASLDPWDEPFAANHRLSTLAMAPSPFGTPPPFSFGSSFPSGDPADPAWQAPDIPMSLFQDSFGFRNHFMGYPGTIEYNSLGQPRIRSSYRDVFGHQHQKRFTCAKAFTRKPLPAATPVDTTDTEEDDILLGRPLPDPEPEPAERAATPLVNTLETEAAPKPAPDPAQETRAHTAGDTDSVIERPPRKRGRLRRGTPADETLNPNCQVIEDTQTAEDNILHGKPLPHPEPGSAETPPAPTLVTEHPPKPATEPAAEPSPEPVLQAVPKAAPEPTPEIGGDAVGDNDIATEGLLRKRGRPRRATTANKSLNSNNRIEALSDAEPEPAGKAAAPAVNTRETEHAVEPAAEPVAEPAPVPVPEPAPEIGVATAGDEDSTTERPRRKRGRPRRATTTDEIINANYETEESQATLGVASTQMPGDTDTPETRANDLSEPQLREERSPSAEIISPTKVDKSYRTPDDDKPLDMSHRRSTRVRRQTDFYGSMVLSTLSRRRRKSHGATAVAEDVVEKEVDQPQVLAQESSQAIPEPTVCEPTVPEPTMSEPTVSKKGESEGAADGSRQVETAPINDLESTTKPKLDERIPVQASEVSNPSVSDNFTVEENQGETQGSTEIPRDRGATTVDDDQDPNYSVMDVDRGKTGSQEGESRPTEATGRDEIRSQHASVTKECGERAEEPSSPTEPAICDLIGDHVDHQLDPVDPTGTAQSPGDQEVPTENFDDRQIIQQLESQNTPDSEPTEEPTERPTEVEPNESGSSTEGLAQAPPKAETVRVLRSRKQIPVGSTGLPTPPSPKLSDSTKVRDAAAENPTEAMAVTESTEHATPKRSTRDLAIRASSKPLTKEPTPISDREKRGESDAAPANPPITHQSDRGPTAATQKHEPSNPETPKRTSRAAIGTTSTSSGKIRSGGRRKSKTHSTTTVTRHLTPSDKRFALLSLVPDDPEYEDELSTLSSALTTPTASKSTNPLSSSSLFRAGLGRANPDHHPLSARSTPRGPPGRKHNGSIGHHLGAKTPTTRLFDRTRRHGSLAPATDPRAYHHHRHQLRRNPSFSGSSSRRKLARAGTRGGPREVHSSPLVRTVAGRTGGGTSTGTTTEGEDEEDEQEGDVVQTPDGATRRCGVDGFVCERDFCFTCCT